jgi:hypothetical protein
MKYVANLLTLIIFAGTVALTPVLVRNSLELQQEKADLGELNHIYYGIFSINAWKGQIAEIAFAEIGRMDLKTTAKQLKATIENQLSVIIDKLNERIKEANKDSIGGKLKQALINLVVDIEEVKKGVPGYADALITEMTSPETEKKVKQLATKQMRSYFAKTYEKQKTTQRDSIVERYGAKDIDDAKMMLSSKIKDTTNLVRTQMAILIGLSITLLIVAAVVGGRSPFRFTLLSLTLLILMGIGVCTPMIDLEAKIAEMSFFLLGHKVHFENQILYFQSKSVLDVFMIMITHKDLLMKFVGVLMISFSVVIPMLKLISSLSYYFDIAGAQKSPVVNFLAFKTGKWSMADVMVVAIFMAYIGFSGIVSNQFVKMKALVPSDIVFMTTNGTNLQPGFFAFLAYAILALIVSGMLKRATRSQTNSHHPPTM